MFICGALILFLRAQKFEITLRSIALYEILLAQKMLVNRGSYFDLIDHQIRLVLNRTRLLSSIVLVCLIIYLVSEISYDRVTSIVIFTF